MLSTSICVLKFFFYRSTYNRARGLENIKIKHIWGCAVHADLIQIQESENKMQSGNLDITNYAWKLLNILIFLMILDVLKIIEVN